MRRAWLLLAFAVALMLWLWRSPRGESPDSPGHNGGYMAAPGYVATDAELIDTGASGRPEYSLHAAQVSQPTPAADIELIAPQFVYHGDTAWTLTAERAVLPPSAQQISLLGEVVARAERAGSVPVEMRTTSLGLDMQARTADSADAVVMDFGRSRLWAAGLHADLQADSLRLKSPVHGEIARLAR